jgi:hypothetical protein
MSVWAQRRERGRRRIKPTRIKRIGFMPIPQLKRLIGLPE